MGYGPSRASFLYSARVRARAGFFCGPQQIVNENPWRQDEIY